MSIYSLIIPLYKSQSGLTELLDVLEQLNHQLQNQLEVVFVDDGSPDQCWLQLEQALPQQSFPSVLVAHAKNFGSFSAIRSGLQEAKGPYFAVMAADLQEPPELMIDFFNILETQTVDVVIGTRESRSDPYLSQLSSRLFWGVYRRFIQKEIPSGGIDIFGCNQAFKEHLLQLEESNSSLVGQIVWLGFRRQFVSYHRQARKAGKSAWTFTKKCRYLLDNIFSFTDLPILLLIGIGCISLLMAIGLSIMVLVSKLSHLILMPGYTTTVIVVCFFSGINTLGLGIIGLYIWRTYENTKRRPLGIIRAKKRFS